MSAKSRSQLNQLVDYFISGGLYFAAGYIFFAFADMALGWSLWWAKISASIFGWMVNYYLQRYWVFKNPLLKNKQIQVTKRYVSITGINFIFDYVIVLGLNSIGITPYIGQVLSAGFFTFWNYFWYKFWVFNVKPRRA